ncbi:MAG: elongation factor G [Clostridiales bacterium]|nr:elongation factor G [Clostridiales bacterium]
MARTQTDIRNIALLGHSGSGKTSIAEAMLYISGAIDRLGKITDGNTVCDYDAEEIKRGFSLSTSIAPVMWEGTKINVLDTPGYLDFVGEVLQALRVAECAVITVDAKAGIEVGTELAWGFAADAKLPRAIFVNKCDDNEANYDRVFKELKEKFGTAICPVTVPCKEGNNLTIINLTDMKAYKYDAKGKRSEVPVEGRLESIAEEYKEAFNDAISMVSEEIMEKVLMEEEVSREEAAQALRQGIAGGDIVPVYCGSATLLWGIADLLESVRDTFPSYTDKSGERLADGGTVEIKPDGPTNIFVFKTVSDPFVGKMSFFKVMNGSLKRDAVLKNGNTGVNEKMAHIYTVRGKIQTEVDELACGDIGMTAKLTNTNTNDTLCSAEPVSYSPVVYPTPYLTQAILPAAKGDEGKISQSIAKMLEEDQTLKFENNAETKQMTISGIGDMQLAVLASKMKARFGVNVKLETPKIPYREKITKAVDVEGKHKKQNGGAGQYGHVKIRFAPGEAEGLTFTVSVVGGTVPKNFNPAVEKGLLDAMQKGIAGFPVVHLAADLYDGSYHPVDSDEISFRMAAQIAFKKCLEQAAPVLLEPVGDLTVTVPDSLVGDIIGDINKRRGSVMGMHPTEGKPGYTTIKILVPKSEILDYPIALRAMSKGLGSMEYAVTGYDVVPGNIAAKIVEDYKKSQEA